VFTFILITGMQAQEQKEATYPKISFFDANISIFTPQGRFKSNVVNPKVGLTLGYIRQYKAEMPFFIGAEFSYNSLGSADDRFTELLDFDLVDFDYSTTSSLFGFNGRFLFFPNFHIGDLEFSLEGKLGFKWLLTTTSKTAVDDLDSSSSNVNKGDLSLTYGIAAGMNFPIAPNIYLNFKLNYLPGLSAAYYTIDPTNRVQSSTLDYFRLRNSNTDLIRWDLGLMFSPSW